MASTRSPPLRSVAGIVGALSWLASPEIGRPTVARWRGINAAAGKLAAEINGIMVQFLNRARSLWHTKPLDQSPSIAF
jgi:hypothetical protein